ncbi:MAG: hypothetical protein WDN69_32670 [Aliidongia sp.]
MASARAIPPSSSGRSTPSISIEMSPSAKLSIAVVMRRIGVETRRSMTMAIQMMTAKARTVMMAGSKRLRMASPGCAAAALNA